MMQLAWMEYLELGLHLEEQRGARSMSRGQPMTAEKYFRLRMGFIETMRKLLDDNSGKKLPRLVEFRFSLPEDRDGNRGPGLKVVSAKEASDEAAA